MSPKTRTRDRSSLPRYRIEVPILIDDMDLSVYAFRLYFHLKRVAERSDEGSCWESARTLAAACNMSAGQVSKAKDELEQKKLITRHIKIMRGGVGDDITIVDIWPQNFARYGPEGTASKESDHHTITSEQKVITTRSLSESDHQVIASSESDQDTITLTSKRSPGDPIDHDQYHIESDHESPTPTAHETGNGVGDDGLYEQEVRQLLASYGIMAARKLAKRYAAMVDRVDLPTIRSSIEALLDPADEKNLHKIARRLEDAPPESGKPYIKARATPKGAPLTPTRPNVPETTISPAEMLAKVRAKNGTP